MVKITMHLLVSGKKRMPPVFVFVLFSTSLPPPSKSTLYQYGTVDIYPGLPWFSSHSICYPIFAISVYQFQYFCIWVVTLKFWKIGEPRWAVELDVICSLAKNRVRWAHWKLKFFAIWTQRVFQLFSSDVAK